MMGGHGASSGLDSFCGHSTGSAGGRSKAAARWNCRIAGETLVDPRGVFCRSVNWLNTMSQQLEGGPTQRVRLTNRLRCFLRGIEYCLLAWSCAIDLAAKRALVAMLCHRQMGHPNLVRDVSAGQEPDEVALAGATVGLDQPAGELSEVRTARGIHDA